MRNAECGIGNEFDRCLFRIAHSAFRKSGQRPAKRAEASGGVRKAPNEPNWNRPLIACHEGVNVDVFGLVYAERTQFRGSRMGYSRWRRMGAMEARAASRWQSRAWVGSRDTIRILSLRIR